jgi:Ca2+-binding RTX toxin-like protein
VNLTQHSNITAAAGSNTVTLSSNGTVTANAAVEEYVLASGANNFTLANVSQTVTGNSGVDEIVGGSGDDTISGLGGDDILSGGLGADRIIGGADEDTLTGGGGADTFVFATGASGSTESTKDTIQDYNAAEDTLEFDVTHSDAKAYTEVNAGADGLRMFGDEFITKAEAAFGLGTTKVYFAAAIGGTANGYLAVDIDGNCQFDGGTDVFVEMTGLSSVDDLSAADITFV